MRLRKELFYHYLSKPHFSNGLKASFVYLLLCVLFSWWHWEIDTARVLVGDGDKVFETQEYYRLFTTTYVHGNLAHLLANSTSLAFLLYFVCQYFGMGVALIHTFIAGALINYLTLKTMNPEIGLVGASGIVYFLWGLWLTLYLLIDRTVTLSRRFMKITAISILMLIPSTFEPGVSYMAHFLGLVCGVGWALIFYILKRKKILNHDRFLIPTGNQDGFSRVPFRADFQPWPIYRPKVSGYKTTTESASQSLSSFDS